MRTSDSSSFFEADCSGPPGQNSLRVLRRVDEAENPETGIQIRDIDLPAVDVNRPGERQLDDTIG